MKFSLCLTTRFLLTTLILMSIFPYGVEAKGVSGGWERPEARLSQLPPFPEDAQRAPVDWSKIDWESEVKLPKDDMEFQERINRLQAQEAYAEIAKIQQPARHMWDDEVMQYYNVPPEARSIVQWHRSVYPKLATEKLKTEAKEFTAFRVRGALRSLGYSFDNAQKNLPAPETGPIINLKEAPTIQIKKIIPKTAPSQDSIWVEAPEAVKNQTTEFESTLKKPKKVSHTGKGFSLGAFLASLIATPANAYYEPAIPIITHYQGIEDHSIEHLLNYLSQTQNEDGSWGIFNQYEITGSIAIILSDFNRIENDQYALAVNYLKSYTPQNDRERAIKARMMVGLGEPYASLLDSVLANQRPDGGFGQGEGYGSDIKTSLEAALALKTANYGTEGQRAAALKYAVNLIEGNGAIRYEQDANPSYYLMNIALQFLEPFKNEIIVEDGQEDIAVQDKISAALGFLANQFDAETATFSGASDIIDELESLRSFQLYSARQDIQDILFDKTAQSQNANGSFGSSLHAAIAALRALSQPDLAIIGMQNAGSLVNGTSAVFELTIKNIGYQTISDMHLHNFVDNYRFNAGYDIGSWGVSLAPGQQTTLTINFNDTASFIGPTEIKFYLEGANEYSYDNNWISRTHTFAPNPGGAPALPMYYIAQKHNAETLPLVNIRWQVKEDANRKNYVLMYRPAGTLDWSFRGIDTALNGSFFGVFDEDSIYEITAGVLHQDETTVTYFSDITEVRMSGDEAKYQGAASGTLTVHNEPTAGLRPWAYGGGFGDATDSTGSFSYFDLPNGTNAVWADETYNPYLEEIITRFAVQSNATTTDIRVYTRYKDDSEAPVISQFWVPYNYSYAIKNQQENILQAAGNDNVAVKEADFYYWDPSEQAWLYIGAQSAVNGGIAEFSWFVPESLAGPGYKVRAVLWDWQGNQSSPAEWGPFEIKDSTPPTGSISVQNLTNSEWPAGEERTISWNIEAQNTLTSIESIKLHYVTSSQRIASNYDISQNSIAYAVGPNSSYVSDTAYITIEACDANLNCAVFQSDTFAITDASPPPPAPWGRPQIFAGLSTNYDLQRNLVAVFQPTADSVEIVYTEFDGLSGSAAGQYRRIMHRVFSNGAWQNPSALYQYWYKSGATAEVLARNIFAVRAESGDVHVAYEKETALGAWQENRDNTEIFYSRLLPDGSIISDVQVSQSEFSARKPKILALENGIISVFWLQGYSWVLAGGTTTLYSASGDGGASWGAPSQVTDTQTNEFAVAESSANNPMAVYQSSGELYARSLLGGQWSQAAMIDADDASFVSDVYVFQDGSDGYNLFYKYGSSATNWKYTVRHIQFSLDAAAASTTVNASRDAIERVESIDVRGYAIAPNNSQGYHIVYTTPIEGGGFGARHLFYDGSQAHFDSYVSSPIMSVEQSMLGVSEYSHIATVYFSGYQGGAQVYLTNQADFSDAIQALANPADGIKNVNHSTSDQSPGKYATQTTVFDPGLSLGAPGEIRLVFSNQNENDFDLRSVIPAIDISVSGGGAVWDAIENTALNADARVLTLGYSAGRLTAGLPVTVEIKKVKNPTQAGSYVFAIQEGAARFSEPASSYSVTSAVADNIIKINAIVLPPSG